MRPYTPLELAGRDIYIREGCYVCHSQMIRPLARRGRALRPLQPRRREHVRPPVPMGVEAHRAGSCPGRRQIFRRVARRAYDRSARHRAGIGHAGLSVPRPSASSTTATSPSSLKCSAGRGVPYTDEMIAKAKADLERQVDPDAEAVKDFLARYPKAQVRQFDGDPVMCRSSMR